MPFTSVDEEIRAKFADYQRGYDAAERALKTHEIDVGEGLVIPSLNEFRCAGQHVARALAADNQGSALENLDQAVRHTHRAEYDAYDAAIQFYLQRCIAFREDYKHLVISKTISSYHDDLVALENIKDEIAKEARKNREIYIEGKQKQYEALKAINRKWELAREELNKCLLIDRNNRVKWLVGIAVAILGIVIALMQFFK